MTKQYNLTAGPGRQDLILSLSEGKPVFFRGIDEKTGHSDLFKVRIRQLKLSEGKPTWAMKGRIIEKNGRRPDKPKNCSGMLNPQSRYGHFHEEDIFEEGSAEYFWGLSEDQLEHEIEKNKSRIHEDLKRLDEYGATLGRRDRLVLEALYVYGLSHACLKAEIHHQFTKELANQGHYSRA